MVHEGEESAYAAWLGDDQAAAGPDVSWEGPVVSLAVLGSPDWEPGTNDFFRQVEVLGTPFLEGERCADPSEEDFDDCHDAFVEAMEAALVRVAQSLVEP